MTRRRFEVGDRGRVPFALVGVLLVVTSALFAGAVPPAREPTEPAVDVVVERTTADARTAFRTAVSEASVGAAASPVLTPAPGEWGTALNRPGTFRDALRVRIYVAARERFGAVGHRRDGVTGSASLEETPTPKSLSEAKRRVSVERIGEDGSELRAEISNVTVTAREGDRVVGREDVTLSVVVPSPVLATHDRVETFESRLNADVTDAGFAESLSVRLWALAWGRGWAQYGGAPISNVVSDRHVELMANGAVLDQQRATFGRSDPDGRNALRTATIATGARDLTSSIGSLPSSTADLLDERLRLAARPSESRTVPQITSPGADAGAYEVSRPNETVDVSVGVSADAAFLALAEGSSSRPERVALREKPTVNQTIQDVYSADVGVVASWRNASRGASVAPDGSPDREVVDRWYDGAEVVNVSSATTGPDVDPPEGFHVLETFDRTVTVKRVGTLDNSTGSLVDFERRNATQQRQVRVAVVGRHGHTRYASSRPIRHVHERGGRFGGKNLANVTDRAVTAVVDGFDSWDELAGRVAAGSIDSADDDAPFAMETIETDWPGEVREWIAGDLGTLRERIRNESVAVPQGGLATYQASPMRRLHERLEANESRLTGVPRTYDSLAEKARAAVRGRYLDEVLTELEGRATERADTKSAVEDRFDADSAPVSFSEIRGAYEASRNDGRGDGPGDDLEFRVDGAPPYLTTMELGSREIPSLEGNDTTYPLVAQNVNHATLPYTEAAESFLSTILGEPPDPKTRLETAGQALRAANRSADASAANRFLDNRTGLRDEIQRTIWGPSGSDHVAPFDGSLAGGLAYVLDDYGVDNARERVRTVVNQWETVDARAVAIANGSVVDPLLEAAVRSAGDRLESRMTRDELRSTLRGYLFEALQSRSAKADADPVSEMSDQLRAELSGRLLSKLGERVNESVTEYASEHFDQSVSRVPAGIPITPVPGAWWATVNTWSVKVRGEYHRFAVETPRRSADAGDPSLSYVRDGGNVTLDVDGDGDAELLGRSDRVSFEAATGVAVVVPAGGSGVGDVNGEPIEDSDGWPHAGLVSERPESCQSRLENADLSDLGRQQIAAEKPEGVTWGYYCRNQLADSSVLEGED